MSGRRNPITRMVLATANDLNGTADGTQYLDATGAGGVVVIAMNNGTDGTAGVDIIEFSQDGGSSWAAATSANLGQGHAGLLLEDGTPAAAADAALNAAGAEVDAVFSFGPMGGPLLIRCARGSAGAGGTAWVTGAPTVVAFRIG